MTTRKRPEELRSHRWLGVDDLRAFGHRARLRQGGLYSNVFMVVLAVFILALLLGVNRYLRTHPDEEAPSPVTD